MQSTMYMLLLRAKLHGWSHDNWPLCYRENKEGFHLLITCISSKARATKNGILGYAYLVGSTSRQSSFSCYDEFQMLKKKVKKVDETVFWLQPQHSHLFIGKCCIYGLWKMIALLWHIAIIANRAPNWLKAFRVR